CFDAGSPPVPWEQWHLPNRPGLELEFVFGPGGRRNRDGRPGHSRPWQFLEVSWTGLNFLLFRPRQVLFRGWFCPINWGLISQPGDPFPPFAPTRLFHTALSWMAQNLQSAVSQPGSDHTIN